MCVMASYYYKCHSANPLIPAISDYCDNTDGRKYCGQLTSDTGGGRVPVTRSPVITGH